MDSIKDGKIEVIFTSLEFEFDYNIDLGNDINLGSITLECEGREYILDVVNTIKIRDTAGSNLSCEIEKDEELFSDCKYDLKVEDIFNPNLKVKAFYEVDELPDNVTLYVQLCTEGNTPTTIALNVEQD